MAFYEVVAYLRIQNQTTPPDFEELGKIQPTAGEGGEAGGLSWSHELFSDGLISVATSPEFLLPEIGAALLTPKATPLELGIFRDGILVQRGPLIASQIEGRSLVLSARGLAYYLRYMTLTEDKTYSDDQTFIVQDLINHHQDKDWGHFGIDTTALTSSGVNRERTYKASELINVNEEIREMGESDDGFDFIVDPETRELVMFNPQKGTDKSDTVIFDVRGQTDPNMSISTAAQQFGTAAFVAGVVAEADAQVSEAIDPVGIETFGLAYVAHTSLGVPNQTELDNVAIKTGTIAMEPIFVPPKEFFAVPGASVLEADTGDTVTYVYDPGFGEITYVGRIKNMFVSVQGGGQDKLTLEFI